LAVRFPKEVGTVGQVAPDLLAAYAPRSLRTSFDVAVEGTYSGPIKLDHGREGVRVD